jgi:transcriptional regulator with XRE-family HTH domain
MNIGEKIRKIREAKNLTQKEVALSLEMDQSQYSKIELGKNDPTTATLEKIAQALGVEIADFFVSEAFEIDSYDKSLVEKLKLLEGLEEAERKSIFQLIDSLFAKKRLKDNLSQLLIP